MSSATIYTDARSAFRAKIAGPTGNGVGGMATQPKEFAWEGFKYEPKQGVSFLEDKLVGGGDTPTSNRAIRHNLSYILTLKYPANVGTADIEAMAGALLDLLKVGTTLTFGSTSVLCMKAERRGAITPDPEWLVLNVQVTAVAWTLD